MAATAENKSNNNVENSALKSLEVGFQVGECIFSEGDAQNRDLYILLAGTVEIYKNNYRLAEIGGAGKFLGEMSALLKIPRSATLKAKTSCRLYRVPEKMVDRFFATQPTMALKLAVILAERLEMTNKMLEEALSKGQVAPTATAVPPGAAGAFGLGTGAGLGFQDGRVWLQPGPQIYVNGQAVTEAASLNDGDMVQVEQLMLQVFLNHPHLIQPEVETPEPEPEVAAPAVEIAPAAGPAPSDLFKLDASLIEAIEAVLGRLGRNEYPEDLKLRLAARVELAVKLEALEEERTALETGEVAEDAAAELARQRRELERIPPRAALETLAAKLRARLEPPTAPAAEAAPPPLSALMRQLYDLALRQNGLLLERERSTPELLRAGAEYLADEPLAGILAKHKIEAHRIFGYLAVRVALEEILAQTEERLREIRRRQKESEPAKSGFLGLGGKPTAEAQAEADELTAAENQLKQRGAALGREAAAGERGMVEEFWTVYEALAILLIRGLPELDAIFVRAWLRRGLAVCGPRYLEAEKVRAILRECAAPCPAFSPAMGEARTYYADEYLELVAAGKLTPSLNEDLELNQRNSPRWRADKAWRRIIRTQQLEAAYQELAAGLQTEVSRLRRELEEDEKRQQLINPSDPHRREKTNELGHRIQHHRVESARLERLLERLTQEMIPKQREERDEAQLRLEDTGLKLDPAELIAQEVKGIRQVSRLVAKLKEPLLPLALRDAFSLDDKALNTRANLQAALVDAENRDPLIFKEPLLTAQKKAHTYYVRQEPVVLISPAAGHLAFMWNPRSGPEAGRLAVPGCFPRPGMRETVFWEVLADFRFDTSKESAGVDLLTSDTLVAAYANMRWNYRKKSKEYRQKAAVYLEENDRLNWRRHYVVYMKSALENGKQLFFKCPELYDAIINKFVDLPAGGEKLRRD